MRSRNYKKKKKLYTFFTHYTGYLNPQHNTLPTQHNTLTTQHTYNTLTTQHTTQHTYNTQHNTTNTITQHILLQKNLFHHFIKLSTPLIFTFLPSFDAFIASFISLFLFVTRCVIVIEPYSVFVVLVTVRFPRFPFTFIDLRPVISFVFSSLLTDDIPFLKNDSHSALHKSTTTHSSFTPSLIADISILCNPKQSFISFIQSHRKLHTKPPEITTTHTILHTSHRKLLQVTGNYYKSPEIARLSFNYLKFNE
jgi:hypothetical protein